MAGVEIKAFGMLLTDNGATNGNITVASTSALWAGARGWLSGTGLASVEIEIDAIVSATVARVHLVHQPGVSWVGYGPQYGGSDVSAYTLAATSRLDIPQQLRNLTHTED